MEITLLPCKLGCNPDHLILHGIGNGKFMVQCSECGSACDSQPTEPDAIREWNNTYGRK